MIFLKQRGATLIIILLISLVIVSLSVAGLESGVLELKSAVHQQQQIPQLYQTENCLQEGMQMIYAAPTPLPSLMECKLQKNCVNLYMPFDLTSLKSSWWQMHAVPCAKNIWRYTQLLGTSSDHYTFYQITVYHFPNQFTQANVGKKFTANQTMLFSWHQFFR